MAEIAKFKTDDKDDDRGMYYFGNTGYLNFYY